MKFLELTSITKEGVVHGKLWLHVPPNRAFAIASRTGEKGTFLDVDPTGAGATLRVNETPQEIMRQLALIYPERPDVVPHLFPTSDESPHKSG